jgi:hypothetical protein
LPTFLFCFASSNEVLEKQLSPLILSPFQKKQKNDGGATAGSRPPQTDPITPTRKTRHTQTPHRSPSIWHWAQHLLASISSSKKHSQSFTNNRDDISRDLIAKNDASMDASDEALSNISKCYNMMDILDVTSGLDVSRLSKWAVYLINSIN